jgi:hypothetical protein
MERIAAQLAKIDAATKVWSVADYAKRHQLSQAEERSLKQLFGQFATAFELQHNAKRKPRWR